jgi:Uri superfamily endonuclease
MRKSPPLGGIYSLVITVPKRKTIRIGRLGPIDFSPGVYVYMGSALNSLHGRVRRHLRTTKQKHWHIDYLLSSPGTSLTTIAVRPTVRKIECTMSRSLQRRALSCIHGFGCSDCSCDSHLHYFTTARMATDALVDLGFTLLQGICPGSAEYDEVEGITLSSVIHT